MLNNVQITILLRSIWSFISFLFGLGVSSFQNWEKHPNIHMEIQGMTNSQNCLAKCVLLHSCRHTDHGMRTGNENPKINSLFNFHLISDRSAKPRHWAKNRSNKLHCKTWTSCAKSLGWT